MVKVPLYIDVGNTTLKGVTKTSGGNWQTVVQCQWDQRLELQDRLADLEAPQWIIGSVRPQWEEVILKLGEQLEIQPQFLGTQQIPQSYLDYETPETLGIDRILACWGAARQCESHIVVIDAGTACTIDWMDDKAVFRGGVIAPGWKMLHSGFQREAPALPAIHDRGLPKNWPGKSTNDSLRWGIAGTVRAMIRGHIEHYRESIDQPFEIWITGGDAKSIKSMLPEYELHFDPYLVFKGMEWMQEKEWNLPHSTNH
ncbi:MAG: type III pantothenate kinase [Bacteroidota bacterium]